jgi:hypothetical protein
MFNVKKSLKAAYDTWIVRSRDQSLQFWADKGYEASQSFLDILGKLADHGNPDNSNPVKLFMAINRALGLSTQMRKSPDNNIGHFKDQVKDSTRPLNQGIVSMLNLRDSKARTALRMLDSVLAKSALQLQNAFPELQKVKLEGGHEDQKRRVVSRDEIRRFLEKHPAAEQYGLDLETVTWLLQSEGLMYFPAEREALVTLINAVNRGETPRNADDILKKTQKIKEELQRKEPEKVHELPEEEAQQALKTEILSPTEQWSRQMQQRKTELSGGRQEEEAAQVERERLQPLIDKRDLEHEERQKQKTEGDLINKYNSLTFERWMRS